MRADHRKFFPPHLRGGPPEESSNLGEGAILESFEEPYGKPHDRGSYESTFRTFMDGFCDDTRNRGRKLKPILFPDVYEKLVTEVPLEHRTRCTPAGEMMVSEVDSVHVVISQRIAGSNRRPVVTLVRMEIGTAEYMVTEIEFTVDR